MMGLDAGYTTNAVDKSNDFSVKKLYLFSSVSVGSLSTNATQKSSFLSLIMCSDTVSTMVSH